MFQNQEANQETVEKRAREIVELLSTEFGDLNSAATDSSEVTHKKCQRINELIDSDAFLTKPEQFVLRWNVRKQVLTPLDTLLQWDDDIAIHGPDSTSVLSVGTRWQKTDVVFKDQAHLMQNIEKVLRPLGVKLDSSCPLASVRLDDGSRFEAIIPPLCSTPTVTVKRAHKCKRTFEDMTSGIVSSTIDGKLFQREKLPTLGNNMISVLKACVEGRVNIIVSGGKGAGKTELLNALCQYIVPHERVAVIEELQELNLPANIAMRFQTEPHNWKGERAIDERVLVQKALRMLPSRIVLGDCRGPEAHDLLSAMSRGVSGSMMSVMADTPARCLQQLEDAMMQHHPNLDLPRIRNIIAAAAPIVIVQIRKMEDGVRRVTEVTEVQALNDDSFYAQRLLRHPKAQPVKEGEFITATLFHLEREGRTPRGFLKVKFVGSERPPAFLEKLEHAAVTFQLNWLKTDPEPALAT